MSDYANKPKVAQLRLLLPAEWVRELDTLASLRFISQLALIRQFLREKIDQELQGVQAQIEHTQELRRVLSTADSLRKCIKETIDGS